MAGRKQRRNSCKSQEKKEIRERKKEQKRSNKIKQKGNKKMTYESPVTKNAPKVYIPASVYDKLFLYTKEASGEVSGVGTVEIEDGNFKVDEIFLLNQSATASSTDLDQTAIEGLMETFMMEDKDIGKLKLWWHTHAAMSVFWSGTDDNTIDGFRNTWMLSIVTNKAGNILGRIDIYNPIRITMNVDIIRVAEVDQTMVEAVRAEIASKVRSVTYTIPATSGRPVGFGYGSIYNDSDFVGTGFVGSEKIGTRWWEKENVAKGYFTGVNNNRALINTCDSCGKHKYLNTVKLDDGTDANLCLMCQETLKEQVEVGQCEMCGEIAEGSVRSIMLGENIVIICASCEENIDSYYVKVGE